MAAFTTISLPINYGRSGYNNKPDTEDDETKDQGRSGYNKGEKSDDDDEE